jgi:Protein of unknown function (DUF3828)
MACHDRLTGACWPLVIQEKKMLKTLLSGLSLLTLFQTGVMAKEPADLITSIYANYIKSADNPDGYGVKDPFDRAMYSARLDQLIDKVQAECKDVQEVCGPVDGDFFVDAQDWEISDLKITTVSASADKAEVEAAFKNMSYRTTVTYQLVNENGNWVIDQLTVAKDGDRGGYTLDEILKP